MKVAGIEIKTVRSMAEAARKVLMSTPLRRLRTGTYLYQENPVSGAEPINPHTIRHMKKIVKTGLCGCAVGQFVVNTPKQEDRARIVELYFDQPDKRSKLEERLVNFLRRLDRAFEDGAYESPATTQKGVASAARAKAVVFCNRVLARRTR